ncbi:MAG: queuosine precursor transporter [Cyclobacteriaceae bacterium]
MNFSKKQNLFIILSAIFLTNALIAEVIGVKIFSLFETFGGEHQAIEIASFLTLDFSLTAGVVIWPVVFITTDIINEYFGKQGVRKVSYIAVGCISFAFIAIYIVTLLPPAPFWTDINSTDANGNPFDINYAFSTLFRQGMGIIVGSLVAFLIGQLLDVFIFQKLRKLTGPKMIWLRATGSTLVSQLVDSFVVLTIAFYVLAPAEKRWALDQVFSVGVTNYVYKFAVAILLTPLIYLGHYLIDGYLGKELSEEMTNQATEGSEGFF